jgi:hypothetical protein
MVAPGMVEVDKSANRTAIVVGLYASLCGERMKAADKLVCRSEARSRISGCVLVLQRLLDEIVIRLRVGIIWQSL